MYFAISIFLSAFLLFQVQPMIARIILPWFGGTPAVWSTVMLFFQALLTGGYGYSYWLIGRGAARQQAKIHVALLGLSVLILSIWARAWPSPITPSPALKPAGFDWPVLRIFLLLALSVGFPYFMLSTNSTLMQAWFGRVFPSRSPYWLYALSNAGSLAGLLAYPVLIEPGLTLRLQGWGWSGGYLVYAILVGWIAHRAGQTQPVPDPVYEALPPPRVPVSSNLLWLGLSATASVLLLAVTNQITQDVAVIPFLWVLPLALYILSFVFAFSGRYRRLPFIVLFLCAMFGYIWLMFHFEAQITLQIALHLAVLFAACMVCHGELYNLRPGNAHLPRYYWMVSFGGVLGGIFVSLLAPLLFQGFWELHIGLVLGLALLAVVIRRYPLFGLVKRVRFMVEVLVGAMAVGFLILVVYTLNQARSGSVYVDRNFYGLVRIKSIDPDDPLLHTNSLLHGNTVHGKQFVAPERRALPTTYYGPESGAGQALLTHPRRGDGLRVGVLGLGIGTLATYGQPGDVYRFYEINPAVIEIANGQGGWFSFLADSRAGVEIVPGDARISLERELAEDGSQQFDLLVVDTFSSDSIPVHLITSEAIELYLDHLRRDGLLAIHISNRYLDLIPVLVNAAEKFDLAGLVVEDPGEKDAFSLSRYVMLARDPAALTGITLHTHPLDSFSSGIRLWTDDYSNLFQILIVGD